MTQRSSDWETLPLAQGDVSPAWPLPTVKPKFSVNSIGGGRPFNCAAGKCERWHAGIDLTSAPDGALIVAPEDAVVVKINAGWSEGSKAAFLSTKSGLFVVLGGFKVDSHKEFQIANGQTVLKGASLGRVLGSYGMIHLETYVNDRTANSPWWAGDDPPKGLLNPTSYVERMVGSSISLVLPRQRHEALATLGYYKGELDAPWGEASKKALHAAQTVMGLTPDGVWGPKTEAAIKLALRGATSAEAPSATEGETPSTASDSAPWGRTLTIALSTIVAGAVGVVLWRRR